MLDKQRNCSSIPGSDKYFFLSQNLKMGCRFHPISCSMDASSFFPEVKEPSPWNWPLTSIQVKNGWSDISTPTYAVTACAETRCLLRYWAYNVSIFMVVPIWKKMFKFDRDYTLHILVICMKLQDCILLGKIPSFVILRSVVLLWWNRKLHSALTLHLSSGHSNDRRGGSGESKTSLHIKRQF